MDQAPYHLQNTLVNIHVNEEVQVPSRVLSPWQDDVPDVKIFIEEMKKYDKT